MSKQRESMTSEGNTTQDGVSESDSSVQTELTLSEWSTSEPLSLTERDIAFIDRKINAERTRLNFEYTADGRVTLRSTHFVGIFSLPDGPTIEIRPKAAGSNLLWLYQYAHGVDATPLDSRSTVLAGRHFVNALAILYLNELEKVWRHGLQTDYRRVQQTEDYLRGDLQLQQQLQRHGPAGTSFECRYDELTADTLTNRAVLYATTILARLVSSTEIKRVLTQHVTRLRQKVTRIPVQAHQLNQIEITRLNDHYDELVRFAELIIKGVYIDDFRDGERPTLAILMDMNRLFEAVVERAAREGIADVAGWRVEGQASVEGLVTGGKFPVRMRPDFVVRNQHDEVILVGDAKWKTGTPSQSDIYQLTAYQLADDVPGLLVYPAQADSIETEYTVQDTHKLRLIELPTAAEDDDFGSFVDHLQKTMQRHIRSLE